MEEAKAKAPGENNRAVDHEFSDVNARAILYFAVALTVAAIVIHLAVWWFYDYFGRPTRTIAAVEEPIATDAPVATPQLQVEPDSELSQLRAHEEQILRSYEWVDREKGIVRIPIDRAIEILASEQLPARKQPEGR